MARQLHLLCQTSAPCGLSGAGRWLLVVVVLLHSKAGAEMIPAGCECTNKTWSADILQSRGFPLDYGTSCAAWDDGACDEHSCGTKQTCDEMWPGHAVVGTWCCRAFCYVDPLACDLDDVGVSVLDAGGISGDVLYYSYDACNDAVDTRYDAETCPWERDMGFESAFSICRTEALANGAPEIFLVQDLSGSYGDDVAKLNDMMDDLYFKLSAQFGTPRIGVGSFVDNPNSNGNRGDHCYQTKLSVTEDFAAVKSAYTGLKVLRGGDGPEAQLDAIFEAATDPAVGWGIGGASDRSRIILLTTDDKSHIGSIPGGRCSTNTGGGYTTVAQARQALEDSDVNVIFAVTAPNIAFYQWLSCELGRGHVVELATDSSNILQALTSNACVLSEVSKATVRVGLTGPSKEEVLMMLTRVLSEVTGASTSQVIATTVTEYESDHYVDATFSILLTSDDEAETVVSRLAIEGDANPIKTKLRDEHGITSFKLIGVESGVTTIAAVDDGNREGDGCGEEPAPRSGAYRTAPAFVASLCVYVLL